MAQIYGLNGAIVRMMTTADEITRFGAPAQYDTSLEFDADTNAAVIAALAADWNAHTFTAGVLYRSGQAVSIQPDGEKTTALKSASSGFAALPDWARTMTATDAATYINGQIWSGSTKAQVDAWIDANIGTVTGANLTAALASVNTQLGNVRTALKLVAGAVLAMRDLFILTAKLLIFIRDLVIRFRG